MYYLLGPLSFFSDSYSDMSQYLPYEKYVRYERKFLPATIYVKKKKKDSSNILCDWNLGYMNSKIKDTFFTLKKKEKKHQNWVC